MSQESDFHRDYSTDEITRDELIHGSGWTWFVTPVRSEKVLKRVIPSPSGASVSNKGMFPNVVKGMVNEGGGKMTVTVFCHCTLYVCCMYVCTILSPYPVLVFLSCETITSNNPMEMENGNGNRSKKGENRSMLGSLAIWGNCDQGSLRAQTSKGRTDIFAIDIISLDAKPLSTLDSFDGDWRYLPIIDQYHQSYHSSAMDTGTR